MTFRPECYDDSLLDAKNVFISEHGCCINLGSVVAISLRNLDSEVTINLGSAFTTVAVSRADAVAMSKEIAKLRESRKR